MQNLSIRNLSGITNYIKRGYINKMTKELNISAANIYRARDTGRQLSTTTMLAIMNYLYNHQDIVKVDEMKKENPALYSLYVTYLLLEGGKQ